MLWNVFKYRFPECQMREGTTKAQACHVIEEAIEAKDAIAEGDRRHAIEELTDVIHCAETTLRMLGCTWPELISAWLGVIRKNARRSYYRRDR